MRRSLPLWIALGLLAIPASSRAEDKKDDPREIAKKDLAKLQGHWVQVTLESKGQIQPPNGKRNAIYKGDSLTLRDGETVIRHGIITLDPSRTPHAINTWDLDGPFEDQVVPGIYKIDGDTLTLCFSPPDGKRPTEFATSKDDAYLLIVMERKKP